MRRALREQMDAIEALARVAFHCPECGKTWSAEDDPNEWAFGHDCETG